MPRGYWNKSKWWSEADVSLLRDWYASHSESKTFSLSELADTLGKHKCNVSRKARSLGLTNMYRRKTATHKPSSGPKYATAAERGQANSVRLKALWKARGHPRGMAGKRQPDHAKQKLSKASKAMWERMKADGTGLMSEQHRRRRSDQMAIRNAAAKPENSYSRCAGGRRADLENRYFRSSWEANFARHLNLLQKCGAIERWAYEPETFWFDGIKRGCRFYTPDFKVWECGRTPYFVEIKGWMNAKSLTKLKRMKKYHPGVEIRIVGEKEYNAIAAKSAPLIPTWETKRGSRKAKS